MDYLKAEYLVNYGEWSSEFSGTDMCNLGMDIMEERNFGNNHCRCLKYIEICNLLESMCIKEIFSFPNCKRVQGACMNMNSKCFMSFLSPRWRSPLRSIHFLQVCGGWVQNLQSFPMRLYKRVGTVNLIFCYTVQFLTHFLTRELQ